MKILGLIPARYASSRFPGKALVPINGQPMVWRVYEQALKAGFHQLYVATDDQRIYDAVEERGGQAIMTGRHHLSGTDRIGEASAKLRSEGLDFDYVVNIQGDEPFIMPEQIQQLCSGLEKGKITTLAKRIQTDEELDNSNVVKVVWSAHTQKALYFSRYPIPFTRSSQRSIKQTNFYKHIGLYGFDATLLPILVKLDPAASELSESLEQLRWLEYGYNIKIVETNYESQGIDHPDDLKKIKTDES
jgi:3-deoxy-manno-octulosonate cytidylyltransferase (CMP-KDO synthetase)